MPFIFIKMNIWNMFHERFLKRKRSGWVPRWSKGSRTPSATLTSSTMGSTASTIYIHKNEHLKHVSWTIFAKKTICMGPKVIWGLSDTLSDLDKLNQGEYSKYQLCSSKWMSLTRSLRVSASFLIILYHTGTVFNWFVIEK